MYSGSNQNLVVRCIGGCGAAPPTECRHGTEWPAAWLAACGAMPMSAMRLGCSEMSDIWLIVSDMLELTEQMICYCCERGNGGKLTIQYGDEVIDFDGVGQRDHSWGASRDWWANTWCWNAGRLEDNTRFHTTGALLEGSDFGVVVVKKRG